MPFPFSTEGRLEVPIGSPEKARYVEEGIQQWLVKQHARGVSRQGTCLHFKGPPFPRRTGLPHFRNALRGVDESKIHFDNSPDRVAIEYNVTLEPFGILIPPAIVLLATAIGSVADLRVLFLLPVILPAAFALAYACWFMSGSVFKSHFRIAAIRGLANGAERELMALQPGHPRELTAKNSPRAE